MTAVVVAPVIPSQPAAPAAEAVAASAEAIESWLLVQRFQAGDREAFAELYRRTYPTVLKFALYRLGKRPLAEDIAQETFVRALRRIDRFAWNGTDVAAWLITIARNLVADHFKGSHFQRCVLVDEVVGHDQLDASPEGDPENAVVQHFTNLRVARRIKELTPEQQECIVLRFFQGLPVAETARTMGITEGAAKALQYRALRKLAKLLDLDMDGDR